jgi:hypothetical protein
MTATGSPCRPVAPSPRQLLIALLLLFAAFRLGAEFSTVEIEDAAEFARRSAMAAVRGPHSVFNEALDADGLLVRRLGADVWERLTSRQKDLLRSSIRGQFSLTLAAPRGASPDIAWSWASPEPNAIQVLLGLKLGDGILKTRWTVRRSAGGWKISDVRLVDPGISLGASAVRALGLSPVRPRDRSEGAAAVALPRIVAVLAIAAVVLLARRRLAPDKRILLVLTASAPAVLFSVDGALAARRALSEPYVIAEEIPGEPWRPAEALALQAQKAGRLAAARDQWSHAIGAGAPAAQVEYQRGQLARQQGDLDAARSDFLRALGGVEPAPGAARELALLALSGGDSAAAKKYLTQYLEAAGPDPESLQLAAVVDTNLGETAAALDAVRDARRLVGDQWKSAELEARVHARAADAAGAVEALRPLAREGIVDRSTLRADPAYLPIATAPVWVAFLNERAAPLPTPPAPAQR